MAYFPTNGLVIKLSISASYTAIAQVTMIKPPAVKQTRIKTTHLTSTAHEYGLVGLPDQDEVEFEFEWDAGNSTHAQLWTIARNSSNSELWQIIWADSGAAQIAWTGGLTNFEWQQAEIDGVQKVKCTVAVGAVTLTP